MLSPKEFAAAWGEGRYVFPLELLRDVDIPEASKTFLLQVGLPLQAEGPRSHMVLLPRAAASPPVQVAKYLLFSRYESTRFRLLAYLHSHSYLSDQNTLYYAVEEKTGHVYWVGPGIQTDPPLFVNTSVAHFAEYLLCFRDFAARFRQAYPSGVRTHVPFGILKRDWQAIDPAALTDPDNYWVMAYYDIRECF